MTRNVAVIVLDTVRKDYFDVYAPRLRSMADTSFEQCRAASAWSVPSHASAFTGELPHRHGIHAERFDASFSFSSLSRAETFLGDLPDHRAVGLSANAYINSRFGFDSLFEEFHDFSIGSHTSESLFPEGLTVQEYIEAADGQSTPRRYLGFLGACLDHDHPARSLLNGVWAQVGHRYKRLPLPEFVDDGAGIISATAAERMDGTDEPAFLFANYMDAHTPLRPLVQYDGDLHSVPNGWSSTELDKWQLNREGAADEAYARNYRQLYGAAIEYLDRRVAALIEDVRAATDRETAFVVTADHGHNLGHVADGGLYHHTGSMSEGLLHVPCLVVNPPEGWPERETRYLSHLELGDLVGRLARGEPFDDDLVGGQIAAETVGLLGEGDGTWGRAFTDEEYDYWNRMIRCVYEGTTKYQWNSLGDGDEYRLDPGRPCWQERVDSGIEGRDDADCFAAGIEEYKRRVAGETQDMAFDDAVEDRLKTLGYL